MLGNLPPSPIDVNVVLLPCPCCDGEARKHVEEDRVSCLNACCEGCWYVLELPVRIWNAMPRRTPAKQVSAIIGRMEYLLAVGDTANEWPEVIAEIRAALTGPVMP